MIKTFYDMEHNRNEPFGEKTNDEHAQTSHRQKCEFPSSLFSLPACARFIINQHGYCPQPANKYTDDAEKDKS